MADGTKQDFEIKPEKHTGLTEAQIAEMQARGEYTRGHISGQELWRVRRTKTEPLDLLVLEFWFLAPLFI